MQKKKPKVAYILRNASIAALAIMEEAKSDLELDGVEVITGTSLDVIPDEAIPSLDLLMAHFKPRVDRKLVEYQKFKRFHGSGVTYVRIGGTAETLEKPKRFGKEDGSYYMSQDADIRDAVRFFLYDKTHLPG